MLFMQWQQCMCISEIYICIYVYIYICIYADPVLPCRRARA